MRYDRKQLNDSLLLFSFNLLILNNLYSSSEKVIAHLQSADIYIKFMNK